MEVALTRSDGALHIKPTTPYLEHYLRYFRREAVLVDKGRYKKREFQNRKIALHVPDSEGGIVTLPGFYSRVVGLVEAQNDTCVVHDLRTTMPEPDMRRVANLGLRGYQPKTIVDAIYGTHAGNGIVRAWMGWGKTMVMMAIYGAYNRMNTIVAVPSKQLLNDVHAKFKSYFPEKRVGIVGDGYCEPSTDITVSTFKSLSLCPLEKCQLLLVDEIQDSATPTFEEALAQMRPVRTVGLTATDKNLFNNADKLLVGIYGERMANIEYQDAVNAGAIVPICVYMVKFNPTEVPYLGADLGTKMKRGIRLLPARNKLVSDIVAAIPCDWQSIICVEQVTNHLVPLHKLMPQGVGFLHRDTNCVDDPRYSLRPAEQRRIVEEYRANHLRHMIVTDAFKAGVDLPNCRVVVQASGGTTETELIQESGRASRVLTKEIMDDLGVTPKTHSVLVDIYDMHDPDLQRMAEARIGIYRRNGYPLRVVDSVAQIDWHRID